MKAMDDNRKHRSELKTVLKLCAGTNSGPAHPHVINVFNTFQVGRDGEDPPRLFIQMELCDGTLGEYLEHLYENNKNLRPKRIINILLQIAEGLKHCHSRSFIHRDLKPTNGRIRNILTND
jgi:serine/threonine protein kinase